MLATYPQYPQPLITTPFGAALFAPPGVYPGNSLFTHEPHFPGFVAPSPLPQTYISPQTPYAAAQQLVLALAQLAQQISTQSVVGQQICFALQQLTQQIQHPYAQIGSPFTGVTSPFLGALQPAWQPWGGQRTPTIQ
jgi:hypothetical protein